MVEDLIMEFEEVPADTAGQLEKLRALQPVSRTSSCRS